jgi:tRNA 2-selenouridine synthase
MITQTDYSTYIKNNHDQIIIDVRSPGEFDYANIPGAVNIPLFTNEERVVVGTAYKKVSKEDAIKIGLDYFGPKMSKIIIEVEQLLQSREHKGVHVHCWRGGMRSGGVAWLLDLYGIDVSLFKGGYKAYRNEVLSTFSKSYNLINICGYTGSGKTKKLNALKAEGHQTIDLEHLACHKGSAFGHIGLVHQPSQEMFENKLALELMRLDPTKPIYIEDESIRIGQVAIPKPFFLSMRNATREEIVVPFESRLDAVLSEYGHLEQAELIAAIERIKKRLGGLETQNAINHIKSGDVKSAFVILLKYYDKYYDLYKEKKFT